MDRVSHLTTRSSDARLISGGNGPGVDVGDIAVRSVCLEENEER